MFQFFNFIVSMIELLVNYLVRGFELLVMILTSMISGVAWLITMIGYLPGWLSAFILVPIALAVTFQVMNKGS